MDSRAEIQQKITKAVANAVSAAARVSAELMRRSAPVLKSGALRAWRFVTQSVERMKSSSFTVIPGNAQFLGTRERQEDALGCSDFSNKEFVRHAGYLGVVADGMGGMAYGREASQTAIRVFLTSYGEKKESESIPDALTRAVQAANTAVLECADRLKVRLLAGTTLVAAVCHEGMLHWISIGDSRAYLVRDGKAVQLTKDHTFAEELDRQVRNNVIAAADAREHPEREHLTSYLGDDPIQEIDRNPEPVPLRPGDRVVLCSDGVYRALSLPEMEQHSGSYASDYADELLAVIRQKAVPQQDNATIVTLTPRFGPKFPKLQAPQSSLPKRIISPALLFWAAAFGLIFVTWYFS